MYIYIYIYIYIPDSEFSTALPHEWDCDEVTLPMKFVDSFCRRFVSTCAHMFAFVWLWTYPWLCFCSEIYTCIYSHIHVAVFWPWDSYIRHRWMESPENHIRNHTHKLKKIEKCPATVAFSHPRTTPTCTHTNARREKKILQRTYTLAHQHNTTKRFSNVREHKKFTGGRSCCASSRWTGNTFGFF